MNVKLNLFLVAAMTLVLASSVLAKDNEVAKDVMGLEITRTSMAASHAGYYDSYILTQDMIKRYGDKIAKVGDTVITHVDTVSAMQFEKQKADLEQRKVVATLEKYHKKGDQECLSAWQELVNQSREGYFISSVLMSLKSMKKITNTELAYWKYKEEAFNKSKNLKIREKVQDACVK